MNRFGEIDLSALPAPDIVDALDYEAIYQEVLADFQGLMALASEDWNALLESDPVVKVLELAAFRELLLRQRINDAARATMLAYAVGADLDHAAANLLITRQVGEPDARFRRRAQLANEGYTTAGSVGAYEFHTLAASLQVADVGVWSPVPGTTRLGILADTPSAIPSDSLLDTVRGYLAPSYRRPLCEVVNVQAAEILSYNVQADIFCPGGPSAAPIIDSVNAALAAYAADAFRVAGENREVAIWTDAIIAALRQPGVIHVVLHSPLSDLVPDAGQAYRLSTADLSFNEPGVYELILDGGPAPDMTRPVYDAGLPGTDYTGLVVYDAGRV